MYNHHTKIKGDLGVLKAKLDLFEQGFMILNPETEHAPFDLVTYKNGNFLRVQVKYRTLNKNGVIEIDFRSSYSFSGGAVNKSVDKDQIDLYAIYCPNTDLCYYLNPKNFHQTVSLRVRIPRNNQLKGIHFADNFRKVP